MEIQCRGSSLDWKVLEAFLEEGTSERGSMKVQSHPRKQVVWQDWGKGGDVRLECLEGPGRRAGLCSEPSDEV